MRGGEGGLDLVARKFWCFHERSEAFMQRFRKVWIGARTDLAGLSPRTTSSINRERVHLIVELVDERPVDRAAAIAKLRSATSEMHFRSSGRLPTRDDLHER